MRLMKIPELLFLYQGPSSNELFHQKLLSFWSQVLYLAIFPQSCLKILIQHWVNVLHFKCFCYSPFRRT